MRRLTQYLCLAGVLLLALTSAQSALGAPGADALPPDFPRLGMWWPDPWEQSLSDIARYDWAILGPWAAEFIPQLRALNPDILLLTSTNACELSYNAAPDAEPWENEDIRNIPPAWFLTQVGSTLTAPVDATATTFHVAAVTATDGAEVYELFVPGDTALIEGESVRIEAVDAGAGTLTVQRGYVRPAASHAAGTRIAAHVAFWPNSWMLNASTLCPTATVSATNGAEIWVDYNARVAADLVQAADWDGILLDRSDADESWIIGNSTARTLDPDQSNTLRTDYATFDAAWNAGIRRYEQALRDAVDLETIIFVNWGMANYDLLNGNNFEGFPLDGGDSYNTLWQQTVFGPAPQGSYFAWLAQARTPNLTMIETYEDDGGPDPGGDGAYDNPADDPGFVPTYRKMRFGLTTALLGDGFFSYEINTNGHGSLGLFWFDEYDNVGAGRGYLGQPRGAAYRPLPALTTPNLLKDGTFEAGVETWELWADDGYAATAAQDTTTAAEGNASARVEVTASQGADWRVEFSKAPVEVISGTEYTLAFWAKADAPRTIAAWVQQTSAPWTSYLSFEEIGLTPTWTAYTFHGLSAGDDAGTALHIGLGATTGTVWLDDVRLQEGAREVWRRDYDGGVALVNATSAVQTVDLGGRYRKIQGAQAPEINDGSVVTQVTLPPLDGLIVLRIWESLYLPVVLRGP